MAKMGDGAPMQTIQRVLFKKELGTDAIDLQAAP
jgi:hypothetical protein